VVVIVLVAAGNGCATAAVVALLAIMSSVVNNYRGALWWDTNNANMTNSMPNAGQSWEYDSTFQSPPLEPTFLLKGKKSC
jgi:hypothetical protein